MFNLKDLGLLLVRVVFGLVFIIHGWDKIQNMEGVIGFFGSLGLPIIVAYVVAWVEFLGGISVLLAGPCSRYAAYALAVVMAGAIFFVKLSKGFSGGYELDLLLLVVALFIAWYKDMPYALSSLFKSKKVEQVA